MSEPALLSVDGLSVDYRARRRHTRAVHDVSLRLDAGETLGLVGESGSGKTTIGRAILGLLSPTAGTVALRGRDITRLSGRERRALAGEVQVVFQDPYSSLNPARTVGRSLLEAAAPGTGRERARARMTELLQRVGLPASAAGQYPSRFSGGQRQRLAIARALMPEPSIVICDEAVSALDVSIQAQVLNLLGELQRETGVAYLFIGHDLDVVRFISDRIVVLYRGRVLEHGPVAAVAGAPRSPYTAALLAAARGVEPPPPPATPAATASALARGCPFAPRCPRVGDVCRDAVPALSAAAGGGAVACHDPLAAPAPTGASPPRRPTPPSHITRVDSP